jgi:DNA-directed RNA polymerase subunit alpha
MPSIADTDIRQLVLGDASFGAQEVQELAEAAAADLGAYRRLRDAVAELEAREERGTAARTRLGLCYYLLGRFHQAAETLRALDEKSGLALYYLARSLFELEHYTEAVPAYDAAAKAGFDPDLCVLGKAEALRYRGHRGDAEAALQLLDKLSGAVEQTAEYLYQRGATVAAVGGNPQEVVALYERAVEADKHHAGALFGLALENDRRGNDEEALALYQQCVNRLPAHVGALLNLGILYEDRQEYASARHCYQRILEAGRRNERARLFLKDAEASGEMFYDEAAKRDRDRLNQVLNTPVTDFELSVRSRNCLQKMGISTLGDLTRVTEQELLASKNFGETSLVEIKEMMASRGLALGQYAHERPLPEPVFEPVAISADEQALLNKPIAELNLSVRARKCMMRLGITTIGELVRRTGDELLEVKNFGVTSLNEVREKLAQHGLRLRGD